MNLTRSPHICGSCSVLLSIAYTFKLNCLKAEEKLKSSLNDSEDKSERKYENEIEGQRGNADDSDDGTDDQTVDYSEESVGSVKEEPTFECEETRVVAGDPVFFEGPPKKADPAEETFPCKFCGVKFGAYRDWFEHIAVHSGAKNNCNICLRGFEARPQLLDHKETHRTSKCDFCGQEFIYKSTFARHVRERHPGEEQPRGAAPASLRGLTGRCECALCGLRLVNKHSLAVHMRRHTGERPFKCGECARAFTQNSALTTHVRTVHLPDRPFRCEACGKAFAVRTLYNLHVKLKHGDAAKEHVCDRCGKAFARRCHLTGHARRIHGPAAGPHVCRVCGAALADAAGLKRHARTHAGEMPFACAVCARRFLRRDHLTVHVRSCARRNGCAKPDGAE